MAGVVPMSVRGRFVLLTAVTFLTLVLLFVGVLWTERSLLMKDRQEKLRNLVEVAHSALVYYDKLVTEGKLAKNDAQNAALGVLQGMRYNSSEYFWVNDFAPTVVMHPIKPELNGKNVREAKDAAGKPLFIEFIKVAKNDGAGFVDYVWPKPGSDAPAPKLSYVKAFEPWGWIVGTGVYIDDVDALFWREAGKFLAWGLTISAFLAASLFLVARTLFAALGGEPNQACEITRRIAAGDLTGDIELASGDKSSLLAGLCSMQHSLRTMISDVASCAQELETASSSLLQDSETVTAATSEQSTAASSMAAAVEEMSVSMDQVSDNAQAAHAVSLDSDRVSGEGEEVIHQATTEMANIATAVRNSSDIVKELGAQSEKIGSIVHTIKDIADQTNLLALNAAIEAARAGEQGRGFAVVADEVRALAERTRVATQEISVTIDSIRAGTKGAVTSMDTGVSQVEDGVRLANQAGDQITRIRSGTQRVMTMVTDISSSIREQSSATQDIARNVERIAQMSEQSATSVKNTAKAAHRLNSVSTQLQQAVCQFKT